MNEPINIFDNAAFLNGFGISSARKYRALDQAAVDYYRHRFSPARNEHVDFRFSFRIVRAAIE